METENFQGTTNDKIMNLKDNSCFRYLKNRTKNLSSSQSDLWRDKDIENLFMEIMEADPDTNLSHCEWIIDQFINKEFLLEDVYIVRDHIVEFEKFYGKKRSLPEYSKMKTFVRKKKNKGESKKDKIPQQFTNCYSYFNNVKKNLPIKEDVDPTFLFKQIENANPTGDFKICIWIVNLLKNKFIQPQDLPDVKDNIEMFLDLKGPSQPMPDLFSTFPKYDNYRILNDAIFDHIDFISETDKGVLLSPLTIEASCYYGAQTSWCTAH
jgi:hypothetical protein